MAAPPAAAETNGQLIVSLTIVIVLGLLGGGLIVAGALGNQWAALAGIIGTIAGALAQALTAPSGIANVLRANTAAAPQTAPETTK
jgi:hypothetical protein